MVGSMRTGTLLLCLHPKISPPAPGPCFSCSLPSRHLPSLPWTTPCTFAACSLCALLEDITFLLLAMLPISCSPLTQDLVLVHWPGASKTSPTDPKNAELRLETWRVLEEFHKWVALFLQPPDPWCRHTSCQLAHCPSYLLPPLRARLIATSPSSTHDCGWIRTPQRVQPRGFPPPCLS